MIPAEDIPHAPACGCNACHPVQPALWSVYSNLYAVDPAEALLAMKADGDPTLFDDPFIELELQIAALLASVYGVRALQAKQVLREALTPPLNPREIDEALAEAEEILGDVFDEDVEKEMRRLINRILIRGALIGEGVPEADIEKVEPDIPLEADPPLSSDIEDEEESSFDIGGALLSGALVAGAAALIGKGTSLENLATSVQVHEGIVAAAKYHTNTHFSRIIIPEIMARVQRILDGENPLDVPGFNDINGYLSKRLSAVPYWRIVANGAASRAYHYGMMKAGSLRQFRGYTIVAVIDDRTSDICLDMDGRSFLLSPTLDLLEKAAGSDDPDSLKDLLPWVPGLDAIEGKSTDELRDLGWVIPPFHPNCRSTIRFI